VDNLSSEYSSRHLTWEFEYLKGDCFDFKYGDITNYAFVESIITENSIIIYNIWNEPDSILGFDYVTAIAKTKKSKIMYMTNNTLVSSFNYIITKHQLDVTIGIKLVGELIGDYGISHKRDPIDTIEYYKKIGNNVYMNPSFEYYTMESVIQFIYFFLLQDMDESILILQPTKIYQ